jgi:hypothetical protein
MASFCQHKNREVAEREGSVLTRVFLIKGRHRIVITPVRPRLFRFNDFQAKCQIFLKRYGGVTGHLRHCNFLLSIRVDVRTSGTDVITVSQCYEITYL